MRLNLLVLVLNCLILSTVAQSLRQHLVLKRASEDEDKAPSKSKDSDVSKDSHPKGDKASNEHGGPASASADSQGNDGTGNGGAGGQAAQPAAQVNTAASSTYTVSQTTGSSSGSWTSAVTATSTGAVTSANAFSNASASSASNGTATSSSSASEATASQTTKVVHKKINMTLAEMPFSQVMCKNNSEVQSGSIINATWLSKGGYSNTVYLRYGLDNYQAWNTAPGGTLPPFAGVKVSSGKDKSKNKDEDKNKDKDIQDPDATYRMTFQTQVFAYQKGIMLSILLYDNQKNATVVTFESPNIAVAASCEKDKMDLEEANDDRQADAAEAAPDDDDKDAAAQTDGESNVEDGDESDDAASSSSTSSSAAGSPTRPPARGAASSACATPATFASFALAFALFCVSNCHL